MIDEEHDQPPLETEETTKRLGHSEDLSQSIPGFRLVQKLGEGGMGEVFEAEQLEPVRRKVALKLIKRGMESKEVLARFDSERQALALMSHPNIAQVYDAGTTEDGRPYFVMEFVQGVPVNQYCDSNRLTTAERLGLFTQICDGVQHAHHKGVIHRDIKPSNVLVKIQDSEPVPKIIDFGIAKATSQRLTEQSVFTAMGEFIGTPEYMSPEQADLTGLDVDTRTDVYSLGVVLYEMLVGAQPFDGGELRRAGFDEMRRKIREDEPPRPSTRLSGLGELSTTAAQKRRSEPATLARQLRGDLDWITMKALEKDRTRRYDSPAELAADIGRHLADQPVLAGPPSTTYRMKKFVRRHTIGVATSALVVLALVLGIAVATLGMVRARTAERTTAREAETALQVSDFLTGLFEVSDPSEARGNTITAREILDKGADEIRSDLGGQPLVQARLMGTMGIVYKNLGLYETARELLEESLAIQRRHLGDEHTDTSSSMNNLGNVLVNMGEYEEARSLYERALEIDERTFGADSRDVATLRHNLASLLRKMGEYDEAVLLDRQALEFNERAFGPDSLEVASNLNNLGSVLHRLGDYEGATPLLERALEIWERERGPDDLKVAKALSNLAGCRHVVGDYDRAVPLCERAQVIFEKVLGPEHPQLAFGLANLGQMRSELGEHEVALALYERALVIGEKGLGPGHPAVAALLSESAKVHRQMGNLQEARDRLERALSIYQGTLGPDHPDVATCLAVLAAVYSEQEDYTRAEPLFQRSLKIRQEKLGADHPEVADVLEDYAEMLERIGRNGEARELEARAATIREKLAVESG